MHASCSCYEAGADYCFPVKNYKRCLWGILRSWFISGIPLCYRALPAHWGGGNLLLAIIVLCCFKTWKLCYPQSSVSTSSRWVLSYQLQSWLSSLCLQTNSKKEDSQMKLHPKQDTPQRENTSQSPLKATPPPQVQRRRRCVYAFCLFIMLHELTNLFMKSCVCLTGYWQSISPVSVLLPTGTQRAVEPMLVSPCRSGPIIVDSRVDTKAAFTTQFWIPSCNLDLKFLI